MGLEISVRKGEVTIRKRGLRGTGLSAKRESWEGLHHWLINNVQEDYCAIDLIARRNEDRVYIEDAKGNNFRVKPDSVQQLVDITGFATEGLISDDVEQDTEQAVPIHIEVNPADYKGIACASPKYLQVITCPFCDNTFEVGNE